MMIAHLPAGYIALRASGPRPRAVAAAFLIGSVLPDIDMLWFHLFDGRQTHHHDFLTHRPLLWVGLLAVSLLIPRIRPVGVAVALGALLHLVLDSIVGKIAWLWPFSDVTMPLVTVTARHDWWVMNLLTHWTFGVELALCAVALALLIFRRRA